MRRLSDQGPIDTCFGTRNGALEHPAAEWLGARPIDTACCPKQSRTYHCMGE